MKRRWFRNQRYDHATEEFPAPPIVLAQRAPAWPGWLQGDVKGCDGFDAPPPGTPFPTAPQAMVQPVQIGADSMTRDQAVELIQPAIYQAICDYGLTRTRFGVSLEAARNAVDELWDGPHGSFGFKDRSSSGE